jgi:signal transduction histidine kinase
MMEEESDNLERDSTNANTEARLKAMEEELDALRMQLIRSEKLSTLGILSAGIAHEIKNPLNFIKNFSELSLEYVEEAGEHLASMDQRGSAGEIRQLLEDVSSNLEKIRQHGERISRIVTSMLLQSRGSEGNFEPVDLNQLLREFVNLAFHGMRAGKEPINVDIRLDLDDSLPLIPLIIEDFSRVILNLCNNAFDALRSQWKMLIDDSRGTDSGSSSSSMLTISSRYSDSEVHIIIEDNGPGIGPEISNKIFEPFFTTKKATQGTGLGLSITKDIVENHKGTIAIESEPGSYTRFIIKLPIQPN